MTTTKMLQNNRNPLRTAISAAAFLLATSVSTQGLADEASQNISIESQPLQLALLQLSRQTGVSVFAPSDLVGGINTSSIEGNLTTVSALNQLLANTDLTFQKNNDGTYIITAAPDSDEKPTEGDKEENDVDEEVVVTGSRIARNASEVAANVLILDAVALKNSGESTLEGALRRLPQNVFGASEVASSFPGNSFNGALNITGGSNINLRGLGSESTLVLVDDRRIGKSGAFGGASDISGIPLQSVARVEIMLDGASAIYGSDAVGGVINIILKKGYDGATASYEYGKPEDGGFEEHVFTLSGTTAWDTGRLSVDFERFQRSNLDGGERPQAIRGITAWPTGRISNFRSPLFYDYNGQRYLPSELPVPTTDPGVVGVQHVVLPEGQTGNTVPLSSITNIRTGSTLSDTSPEASEGISLIPSQQRSNLQLRFEQQLSENINIGANLYYSDRNTYTARGAFTTSIPTDPLTNDSGSPFEGRQRIQFRLPGFADQHNETEQTVTRWNLYANGELGDNWQWETSVGQSRDRTDSLYINDDVRFFTAASVPTGLNLFTGDILGDNSPELLSQLIAPPTTTASVNEENTFEFRANGAPFQLPGGDVNIAIGGEWRQESLESRTETDISDISELNFSIPFTAFDTANLPTPISAIQRSGFAEVLLPLVSSNNAFTAVQQLTLTGAGRYDSYGNLGSDSIWSLGVVWSPVDQILFKLRRSTSYVAPTPREKVIPVQLFDNTAFIPGGTPLRIVDSAGNVVGFDFLGTTVIGGNPDLEAENAATSTAIVEITPDILPGLRLSASWHETEYINRISPPPFLSTLPAGIDYVADNPALSRDADGLLILDRRALNTALVYQSGVDYQLYYSRDTELGEFYITTNVAVTSNYESIHRPGKPRVSRLERAESSQVIPTRRYSTDFGWNNRGLSIAVTANTTSKTYRELGANLRITEAPWNVNLTMSYNMDEGNLFSVPSWLSGTSVSFRVLNVLNDFTEHTIVEQSTGDPVTNDRFYNSALTDPRGRMVYFGLTKQF